MKNRRVSNKCWHDKLFSLNILLNLLYKMQKKFDHILYGTHSRAKWSLGCRCQNLAPRRRHFLWNLKCEYLKKERSCGAKTFMANRYYNVCYAQSIVFMFHELLRFIITKQSFLHLAPRRRHGATQCLDGSLKSRPRSKGKHFLINPLSFILIRMCSFCFSFEQSILNLCEL